MQTYSKALELLKEIHAWAISSGVLLHGGPEAELFGKVSDVIAEIETQPDS